MRKNVLDHHLEFSVYTNPGCYKDSLKSLPNKIEKLGVLIAHQIIHRITLKEGNKKANKNLIYGDMNKFSWYRLRCEDDILPNAISMIAELFRLDSRGFKKDRKVEDKIVVTCRHNAILMASILKSKGIPARVRSGFAPYFFKDSWDHWINQYWDEKQKRWITFDSDGFFDFLKFDQYNIPDDKFDWAAKTWLDVRQGKRKSTEFKHAGGLKGLFNLCVALFYDFHCLMNNEITYYHTPNFSCSYNFKKLTEKDFKELDELATLMLDPDKNFDKLKKIWETKKKYRILSGGLISESDHVVHK